MAVKPARLAGITVTAGTLLVLLWIGAMNLDRYFNLMSRDPKVIGAYLGH